MLQRLLGAGVTVALMLGSLQRALAEDLIPFNFKNVEMSEVLSQYSKATGQQFVFEPNLAGRAWIVNPKPISKEEAFNQLADALALNGYSWVHKDQVILVRQARKILRDGLPVVKELPPLRPQMMVTWIYNFKHASAEQVYRELRVLQSNEGEQLRNRQLCRGRV